MKKEGISVIASKKNSKIAYWGGHEKVRLPNKHGWKECKEAGDKRCYACCWDEGVYQQDLPKVISARYVWTSIFQQAAVSNCAGCSRQSLGCGINISCEECVARLDQSSLLRAPIYRHPLTSESMILVEVTYFHFENEEWVTSFENGATKSGSWAR